MQKPFFRVDDGVAGIGAEACAGHVAMRHVVFHALPAAFLIAAEDKAHFALKRQAGLFHGVHGVQRRCSGSLVVGHTAAIHASILDFSGKGRHRPAVAGGHHVQMHQNGQRVHAQRTHPHIAGIAVKVAGFKAHGRCVRKDQVQCPPHLAAKGSAGFRSRLHAGHLNPALQGLNHFLPQLVDDDAQVLHVCVPPSLHVIFRPAVSGRVRSARRPGARVHADRPDSRAEILRPQPHQRRFRG